MVSTRRLTVLFVVAFGLLAGSPTGAGAAPGCQALRVPVAVDGVPGARLYGELCRPTGQARAVQLLVHGASYNHLYWDWPLDPARYSYVRRALAAGYATFNVDRLGAGASTRPASELLSPEHHAQALHGVIAQLRSGAIGGNAFQRVIWVGHSFGSLYGWLEADTYADVDAFVLTGTTHVIKPSGLNTAIADTYPAQLDRKFQGLGLDGGYLTSVPGTRGAQFYYAPGADRTIIAADELLKDLTSGAELGQGIPLLSSAPPETAPSRAIKVPTLLVLGAQDALFCGPPDGLVCTAQNLRAQEAPYYSPEARLDVRVVSDTGHSLQLHRSASRTSDEILAWLGRLR